VILATFALKRLDLPIVIVIAWLLLAIRPAMATTYYVSTTGSDSNNGSLTAPFRTIQKAANIVNPGDIVYIRGGVYNARVVLTRSGSSNQYITFQSYPGETATLDGTGLGAGHMIRGSSSNISYLKIIGLKISNFFGTGIQFDGGGSHIEIRNNEISYGNVSPSATNTGHAILITSELWPGPIYYTFTDIVIDGNNIHNFTTGPRYYNECLTVAYDINRFQITDNAITSSGNIGIDTIGRHTMSYSPYSVIDAYPHNGIISGNVLTSTGNYAEDSAIYLDGSHDVTVEKNEIYDGIGVGITVSTEKADVTVSNIIVRRNLVRNKSYNTYLSSAGGTTANSRIVHNTFVINSGAGRISFYVGNGNNNVVKNNIYYSGASTYVNYWLAGKTDNSTMDYNLLSNASEYFQYKGINYYSNTPSNNFMQYKTATSKEAHSITGNPLFTDPSSDYTLQSGSPAIDAGQFLTTTTSSGSGTSVPVADARYFQAGYGISGVPGDIIMVGSNTVTVNAVNYSTNTITVNRNISWNNGDGVSYPHSGLRPDIGSNEYVPGTR
jgi:hypothetical protein